MSSTKSSILISQVHNSIRHLEKLLSFFSPHPKVIKVPITVTVSPMENLIALNDIQLQTVTMKGMAMFSSEHGLSTSVFN